MEATSFDTYKVTVTLSDLSCPVNDDLWVTLACANCKFLTVSVGTGRGQQPNITIPRGGRQSAGNAVGSSHKGTGAGNQRLTGGTFENYGNWAQAIPLTTDGVAVATFQVLTTDEPFDIHPGTNPTCLPARVLVIFPTSLATAAAASHQAQ